MGIRGMTWSFEFGRSYDRPRRSDDHHRSLQWYQSDADLGGRRVAGDLPEYHSGGRSLAGGQTPDALVSDVGRRLENIQKLNEEMSVGYKEMKELLMEMLEDIKMMNQIHLDFPQMKKDIEEEKESKRKKIKVRRMKKKSRSGNKLKKEKTSKWEKVEYEKKNKKIKIEVRRKDKRHEKRERSQTHRKKFWWIFKMCRQRKCLTGVHEGRRRKKRGGSSGGYGSWRYAGRAAAGDGFKGGAVHCACSGGGSSASVSGGGTTSSNYNLIQHGGGRMRGDGGLVFYGYGGGFRGGGGRGGDHGGDTNQFAGTVFVFGGDFKEGGCYGGGRAAGDGGIELQLSGVWIGNGREGLGPRFGYGGDFKGGGYGGKRVKDGGGCYGGGLSSSADGYKGGWSSIHGGCGMPVIGRSNGEEIEGHLISGILWVLLSYSTFLIVYEYGLNFGKFGGKGEGCSVIYLEISDLAEVIPQTPLSHFWLLVFSHVIPSPCALLFKCEKSFFLLSTSTSQDYGPTHLHLMSFALNLTQPFSSPTPLLPIEIYKLTHTITYTSFLIHGALSTFTKLGHQSFHNLPLLFLILHSSQPNFLPTIFQTQNPHLITTHTVLCLIQLLAHFLNPHVTSSLNSRIKTKSTQILKYQYESPGFLIGQPTPHSITQLKNFLFQLKNVSIHHITQVLGSTWKSECNGECSTPKNEKLVIGAAMGIELFTTYFMIMVPRQLSELTWVGGAVNDSTRVKGEKCWYDFGYSAQPRTIQLIGILVPPFIFIEADHYPP